MRDLQFYQIPLEGITLERIDPTKKEHKKAISKMRDNQARKMMYDVKQLLNNAKKDRESGNSYLLKSSEKYIGCIWISNLHDDQRGISMMIEKSMRNQGFGRIILNSVSEYLFRENLAASLVVNIKDKNKNSIHMANSCGFEESGKLHNTSTTMYERKK